MKPSALALLLIAIVVATFGAVRDFAFLNFDDNVILSDNPFVRGGLSWINVQWALTHQVIGQWQPLTTISHQLDCQLFGLDAGAHHVVNLLFHLGSALALFVFVRRLTGTLGEAFFVAAIFALHPMRIESVAWVAERKDVLSVFFGMLALTSYLGGRRTLTMIFFAASLAAKPMLVTLPLIFLLVDQLRGRVSLADKIPYAALSLLFSVAALVAQSGGGALRSNAEAPVAERLATAFVGYLAHLGKFFWPTALGIFYPSTTYFPGVGAGALLGLVAITAFCHQRRWLRFGWLWFLVALLPVIGFVSIGGHGFADRYSYFPDIGLILAVTFFVREKLAGSRLRFALPLAGTALVAACMLVTRHELLYWRDSIAIWEHTLEISPENFMAHTNLGVALDERGDLAGAVRHCEEAVRLRPYYPEALNNLGSLRARQGRLPEARELFRRALARRPDFEIARNNLRLASLPTHDERESELERRKSLGLSGDDARKSAREPKAVTERIPAG